ncbi:MAG: acetylornithine carbamoyltransferase [Ignavibacteriae bacterium HGW-Ignavibacteriae-4]|jgi:N-succinyl-L-ornithine transcarbamylase|nr:MAG: acetylornithine carbamoyltransferase [Ignavibacteriae bacterium HGW-Ignavibacteriae-4]
MKNFTSINDVNNVQDLLQKALEIKQNPYGYKSFGENKTLGLIFLNPSLRTRLSSQKAAQNLGMNVMVMNMGQEGWQLELEDGSIMDSGAQEHIKDAAAVISQYCDIIGVRSFATLKDREFDYKEEFFNKFIGGANVPLISLESATLHPLQSFADLITIEEQKKVKRPKVVLTWAPHPKALPQAVANSFAEWMSKADVDLTITHPAGYELSEEFTKGVKISHNQDEALQNADFVYAKNWSSYSNYGLVSNENSDWQITKEKMSLTNNGKFMHCLPIRRNVVASDEVLDSPNSLILEQANNRTFAAQTILLEMLRNEK